MSKMSNIAMELDEHAVELGFVDHLEALANGYDWRIDETGVAKLFKNQDPQEEAHKAWLEEQEHALNVLDVVHDVLIEINAGLAKTGDIDLVEAWSLTELAKEIEGVEKFVKEAHD